MRTNIYNFYQVYDGEDFPDTYVKFTMTQHMRLQHIYKYFFLILKFRIIKSKKTSMVRRSMEPSYDQSFDIKLTEEHLGVTFLTVQLKQSRLFAVKGDFCSIVHFCHNTSSDLTLGSVIIGSSMFARHSGLKQWERAVTRSHLRGF